MNVLRSSTFFRWVSSLETRFVARLPYLSEGDSRVETMEYAKRKSETLHERPGDESVEIELNLEVK